MFLLVMRGFVSLRSFWSEFGTFYVLIALFGERERGSLSLLIQSGEERARDGENR